MQASRFCAQARAMARALRRESVDQIYITSSLVFIELLARNGARKTFLCCQCGTDLKLKLTMG